MCVFQGLYVSLQLILVSTPSSLGQYRVGYMLITTEAVYLLRRGVCVCECVVCECEYVYVYVLCLTL